MEGKHTRAPKFPLQKIDNRYKTMNALLFFVNARPALNLLPEADGKQRFGGCAKLKDAVKHAVQCC